MNNSNKTEVAEFTDKLVRQFRPEKVLFFGSKAYGTFRPSSDVDLLVITNTRNEPIEQEVRIQKAITRDFPLDLLVMTRAQIAERLRIGDPFMRTIVKRGRALYEGNNR